MNHMLMINCTDKLGLNCKASNGGVHMLIKELTRVL